MPALSQHTSSQGKARGSFRIESSDTAWRVLSGSVDLFLAENLGTGSTGWRSHVLRVQAGEAIYGLGSVECEYALLACPTEGTATELLHHSAADESTVHPSAVRWITSLSEAFRCDPLPARVQSLENAEFDGSQQHPVALSPGDCMVWVRRQEGVILVGDPQIPLETGAWFPVTRGSWIQVNPGGRLQVSAKPDRCDMREFHRIAFRALIQKRIRRDAEESARLAEKALRSGAAYSSSLDRLRSALGAKVAAGALETGNPLFDACQAAARHQGIDLRAPTAAESARGNSAAIQKLARASGIRCRQVALRGEWWKWDGGAYVAFRNDEGGDPLALLPGRHGGYLLWDPSHGGTQAVKRSDAAGLHGMAWSFHKPFPAKPLRAGAMLRFGLAGCGPDLLMAGLMGLAAGSLGMAAPVATAVLIDSVIPAAQRSQLAYLGVLVAVCAISSALFQLAGSYSMQRVSARIASALQTAVWDRILNLPATFFRGYSSGDLAQRSMAVDSIHRLLSGPVMQSLFAGVASLLSVVLVVIAGSRLAIVAFALVLFTFLINAAFGYRALGHRRTATAQQGRIASLSYQFISGIAKLRVSGVEGRAFSRWAVQFSDKAAALRKANRIRSGLVAFNASYPVLCLSAIYAVGAAVASDLRAGGFLAFAAAFTTLLHGATQLSGALTSALELLPEYERLKPVLEAVPEAAGQKATIDSLEGGIEVNHVSFRYASSGPPVLRDVSCQIRPGEFVAFVGESGSGKSTLLRLLLGFEQPAGGAIYYDRQALSGLDTASLRRQIGVVLQSGRLMSGDILSNIAGSRQLTVQDAWEAARVAGMEDDIRAMPMGIYTVLSEGGGGLSGGQRQRLMIARAVASKPRILFLDEATSALDNRTQAIVSRSLAAMNATRVVIAHRLSTVRHADRIFVMHRGEIVEQGTFGSLMALGGRFAALAHRQMVEGEVWEGASAQ